MKKLFLFKAVPFDKTDDSITEEYLIFNNKPSFENLKKAFESNYIYFSEKFTLFLTLRGENIYSVAYYHITKIETDNTIVNKDSYLCVTFLI